MSQLIVTLMSQSGINIINDDVVLYAASTTMCVRTLLQALRLQNHRLAEYESSLKALLDSSLELAMNPLVLPSSENGVNTTSSSSSSSASTMLKVLLQLSPFSACIVELLTEKLKEFSREGFPNEFNKNDGDEQQQQQQQDLAWKTLHHLKWNEALYADFGSVQMLVDAVPDLAPRLQTELVSALPAMVG